MDSKEIIKKQFEILKADKFNVQASIYNTSGVADGIKMRLYYITKTLKIGDNLYKALIVDESDIKFIDKHTKSIQFKLVSMPFNPTKRFYKNELECERACDLLNLRKAKPLTYFRCVSEEFYFQTNSSHLEDIMVQSDLPSVAEITGENATEQLFEVQISTWRPTFDEKWVAKAYDIFKEAGLSLTETGVGSYYLEIWSCHINSRTNKQVPFSDNLKILAKQMGSITNLFPNGRHTNMSNRNRFWNPDIDAEQIFIKKEQVNVFANKLRKLGKDPIVSKPTYSISKETVSRILELLGHTMEELEGEVASDTLFEGIPTFEQFVLA